MSCDPSTCRHLIDGWLQAVGAACWGVTAAGSVDAAAVEAFRAWVSEGNHGKMGYLERYDDVRADSSLLLEGARSIISCAFPYPHSTYDPRLEKPQIASYALGRDYHIVVKELLGGVAEQMDRTFGCRSRVCVDTAPIMERWHAVRAGIGFIGRNRMLIVPEVGSYVFLGEIVTTLELNPDSPCSLGCDGCNRCLKACPGSALSRKGLDARRCVSYLTIENRDESLPPGYRAGQRIYGCDRCQQVCPHNLVEPSPLPQFEPRAEMLALDSETIMSMTGGDWKRLTRDSAMSRITLKQLRRNLAAIKGTAEGQNDVSSSIE